jgi:hypothetical protein
MDGTNVHITVARQKVRSSLNQYGFHEKKKTEIIAVPATGLIKVFEEQNTGSALFRNIKIAYGSIHYSTLKDILEAVRISGNLLEFVVDLFFPQGNYNQIMDGQISERGHAKAYHSVVF